jgi:hypothetical protein
LRVIDIGKTGKTEVLPIFYRTEAVAMKRSRLSESYGGGHEYPMNVKNS